MPLARCQPRQSPCEAVRQGITASADRYRRRARQLRARLASRPAELYRNLQELAAESGRSAAYSPAPRTELTPPARARFAELVASAIDGPVLVYASRLKLIRKAARMGISRFEANLIIAAVLHRATTSPDDFPISHRSLGAWHGRLALTAVVLLVQFAILLGALRILNI